MKKKYLAILLALCLVLCFLPAVALADGATIYVDNAAEVAEPDGSATNPYATIGAAVAAANGGDIIIIQNGTYNENVTIDKELTLQGESEDGVIIQFDYDTRNTEATFAGTKAYPIVYSTANLTLENLTIAGPTTQHHGIGGVLATDDLAMTNVTVEDIRCTADGGEICGVQYGRGIMVEGAGDVDITNCTIQNFQKNAIDLNTTGNSVIENNTITGVGEQQTIAQNGVVVRQGDATISGNNISDMCYNADDEWAYGSTGIYVLENAGTVAATGNTLDAVDAPIYVDEAAADTFTEENNTVTNPTASIYIGEQGYGSVEAALAAAGNGDTIELLAGAYTLPEITKAVNLKGTGEVIIEGNIMYNVAAKAENGESITVEGLTIQGSNPSDNAPGLCWNRQSTLDGYTLNVKDCTFENWKYGVGVNSGATHCTLNVENSTFDSVWCAVSLKAVNTLGNFDAETTEGCYAIQSFGRTEGETGDLNVNNYYNNYENYKAGEPDWDAIANPGAVPSNWEAKMGNTYGSLQELINAASGEEAVEITLLADVTGPITIDKDNITINGNGKEITATGMATAVTINADNVTLKDVNASSQWGIALVVANGATGAEVNGGSYATCTDTGNFPEDYGKQGAIRFEGANGDITVTGADLTGGLHIVNYTEGTVKASDNTIGFDYTGETAVVGILVQGEGASNLSGDSLFKNNEVTVPNTNSFYVQVRDDAGTVNEEESVSATTSTVKIGNAFYPSLQAAVDAVEDGGIITLVAETKGSATVGREVTFTLDENGFAFTGSIKAKSGWKVEDKPAGEEDEDVTVYTVTKRSGGNGGSLSGGSSSSADTYDIDIASGLTNGTVKANVSSAEEGDTVTLTVTPATGYVLSTLTVTDADDNTVSTTAKSDGTYTFTMPDADVEVTATFVEGTASDIYTDVPANAWYANAVNYVTENGLMNGYGDGLFGPNDVFSRAMVAQVIYNMENKPAVSTSGSFNDVTAGAWYADAINWAAQNEIVNGDGNGTFAPNNQITREQMAAVLYRYAQYKGYDVTAKADLSTFSDAASVSAYATDAMQWIVASGIMEGMDGTLVPQGNATRAQVATMLMRFAENVAK